MAIKEIKGNIFTTEAQTIVNTVNCVGVMGAGIALEFRLREPEMYRRYVALCEDGKLSPGKLWLYKSGQRWVLNFPTKKNWKHPSKVEYLELGLEKFTATYRERGIRSIAFPLLGADKGGLPAEVSRNILKHHLSPLTDLDVEIYEYDPKSPDDLFDQVKEFVLGTDISELKRSTGITAGRLERIIEVLNSNEVCQISQLGQIQGIGVATLEKLFALRTGSKIIPSQKTMDL